MPPTTPGAAAGLAWLPASSRPRSVLPLPGGPGIPLPGSRLGLPCPFCLSFLQAEEDWESGGDAGTSRRNSRLLMSSFSKRKVQWGP